MRYLIENVWYWRARLVVDEFSIDGEDVEFKVTNQGRASTRNATLQYVDGGKVLWESQNFTANASSTTTIKAVVSTTKVENGGYLPKESNSFITMGQ